MRRRQFLTALPAVAGLPGCIGQQSTRTATETAPAQVVVRAALGFRRNHDAVGFQAPKRAQFAFVKPPRVGTAPPPDAHTLDLDGTQFSPRSQTPGFALATPGVGEPYTEDESRGWLVFDLPTLEVEQGMLLREDSRSPLPPDSLSTLAAAPEFTLQSVSVPDAVPADGTISATVDVRNRGGRDGLFLAGLQRGGRSDLIAPRVPVGETRTATAQVDVVANPGEEVYVQVISAVRSEGFSVRIEEGSRSATE